MQKKCDSKETRPANSKNRLGSICILLLILMIVNLGITKGNPEFNGKWTLIRDKSTEIDLYSV